MCRPTHVDPALHRGPQSSRAKLHDRRETHLFWKSFLASKKCWSRSGISVESCEDPMVCAADDACFSLAAAPRGNIQITWPAEICQSRRRVVSRLNPNSTFPVNLLFQWILVSARPSAGEWQHYAVKFDRNSAWDECMCSYDRWDCWHIGGPIIQNGCQTDCFDIWCKHVVLSLVNTDTIMFTCVYSKCTVKAYPCRLV